MGTVKIRMNTWSRCGNRETKFKRNIAARDGFIDYDKQSKKVIFKPTEWKWKAYDTSIPRRSDRDYIANKRESYSGLCFSSKSDAEYFMKKHKTELDAIAAENPLFDRWTVMNCISRFKPNHIELYGKDIIED